MYLCLSSAVGSVRGDCGLPQGQGLGSRGQGTRMR